MTVMQESLWQVDGPVARLEGGALRAEIDLRHPEVGLRVQQVATLPIKDTALFRIDFSRLFGAAAHSNGELVARGNDLIATFSETPGHPFRVQAYWRLLDHATGAEPNGGSPPNRPLAAIELILSVQTSLLDSDPTLFVESILPAAHVERLVGRGKTSTSPAQFEQLTLQSRVRAATGTGCFRLAIVEGLHYVEIVHPADFEVAEIEQIGTGVGITHRLFAHFLEKGVILRSRIRGLFYSATPDVESVAQAYDEFVHSEPPLTA